MESADSYAAEVDRLLAAAVSLFPSEQQPVELQRGAAPGVDLPDGVSGLVAAAEQATQGYHHDDARAAGLSDALHDAVKQASGQAQQAGAAALAIRQTALTEAQAVTAEGHDPHNLVLLVSQMDDRLRAMQDHIEHTREGFAAAAQRIEAHGVEMAAIRQG
jgi:hypothetical protein